MKSKQEQDERVIAQNRKINSEAYSLMMMVLILSVPVQQFILHAPPEQYAVEFFCFVGASLYTIVRQLTLGLNVFGEKSPNRIMLTNGIVTGLTVTVVSGVLNYTRNADKYKGNLRLIGSTLLITFVTAMASSFAVMFLFQYVNGKRQKQIKEKLDAEEQGN